MMKSKIKFLNHSSLIVKSDKTSIICDPWFTGNIFNKGWRLVYDKSHSINKLKYDYIWISHEHPDHFNIRTLKNLKRKKFLYQSTKDKKVLNFLKKNNNKVNELEDAKTYKFGNIEITNFICDGYDCASLFYFENGSVFLNVNDAKLEINNITNKISNKLKKDNKKIDLLSIQFSYANWAGNIGDKKIPLIQQNSVLERIYNIHKVIEPCQVMLFASFIYLSNSENFYWNEYNWLEYTLKNLKKKKINFILPHPNQEIDLLNINKEKNKINNSKSLNFWKLQYSKIKIKDFAENNITLDDINIAYNVFYKLLWSKNSKKLFINNKNQNFSLKIKLSENNKCIELFLFRKELKVHEKDFVYDISLTSENLLFLLKYNYGRGTILINSCIQFNYELAIKFFIFFYIYYKNNLGIFYKKNFNKKEFLSIKSNSVFSSIYNNNANTRKNYRRYINFF